MDGSLQPQSSLPLRQAHPQDRNQIYRSTYYSDDNPSPKSSPHSSYTRSPPPRAMVNSDKNCNIRPHEADMGHSPMARACLQQKQLYLHQSQTSPPLYHLASPESPHYQTNQPVSPLQSHQFMSSGHSPYNSGNNSNAENEGLPHTYKLYASLSRDLPQYPEVFGGTSSSAYSQPSRPHGSVSSTSSMGLGSANYDYPNQSPNHGPDIHHQHSASNPALASKSPILNSVYLHVRSTSLGQQYNQLPASFRELGVSGHATPHNPSQTPLQAQSQGYSHSHSHSHDYPPSYVAGTGTKMETGPDLISRHSSISSLQSDEYNYNQPQLQSQSQSVTGSWSPTFLHSQGHFQGPSQGAGGAPHPNPGRLRGGSVSKSRIQGGHGHRRSSSIGVNSAAAAAAAVSLVSSSPSSQRAGILGDYTSEWGDPSSSHLTSSGQFPSSASGHLASNSLPGQPLSSSLPTGPSPSRKPKKNKFSADDDELLVKLKEVDHLSWREIADRFQGRSPGALQVRYCTRLKTRPQTWTADDIRDLKDAVALYQTDRWLSVAQKLDNRYTPTLCRLKWEELAAAEKQ